MKVGRVSLWVYAALYLNTRHTAFEELLRHVAERHPLDAFVLVDVLDDPATSPSARSFSHSTDELPLTAHASEPPAASH